VVFKLIIRTVRTFSEAKEKYQEISLDFWKNLLPLSSEIGRAVDATGPTIPAHLR